MLELRRRRSSYLDHVSLESSLRAWVSVLELYPARDCGEEVGLKANDNAVSDNRRAINAKVEGKDGSSVPHTFTIGRPGIEFFAHVPTG